MVRPSHYRVAPAVLALALAACGHSNAPPAPPPLVGVVTVQPQTIPLTGSFVGRLSAFRSADIYARVPGVLLKRTYKEGSDVKAGQLLFQIDPAPFRAAYDNARAQLAQAQANATNAVVNADRARKLAPQGYVSQTDLDNALATERSDKAAVEAAQATVESARINLGYASVTSPIAGRAGEQQVTEGALVGQGSATLLTTVDQIDPLYVNFTISVGELDELRQAQKSGAVALGDPGKTTVAVALPNGTAIAQSGTLDFSSVNVNPATGAVNLRALLPNPQHALLPGSFVNLQVNLGQRHHVFLVPQPAMQRDIGGPYVFIVGRDGKVARRAVATDGTHGIDWIVTSGLAAGDAVIVSGIQSVQVGQSARGESWHQTGAIASGGSATSTAAPVADGG